MRTTTWSRSTSSTSSGRSRIGQRWRRASPGRHTWRSSTRRRTTSGSYEHWPPMPSDRTRRRTSSSSPPPISRRPRRASSPLGVAGGRVTLTWIAPPDPADDLAGYDIERDGIIINAELVPPDVVVFVDADVTDRTYQYRVVAVDEALQRRSTDPVTATVLTPFWDWTPAVTTADSTDPERRRRPPARAWWRSSVFVPGEGLRTGSGRRRLMAEATSRSRVSGSTRGPTPLTATSGDDDGNTSRISLPLLLVSHLPPEPPENLAAVPTGSDVTLTWTASADPESVGVTIRRDGTAINETVAGARLRPRRSHSERLRRRSLELGVGRRRRPGTGWAPTRVPTRGTPEWWSWSWPEPVELDEITVGWSQTDPPQVFDIDVLTGGGWLWLTTLSWDGQPTVTAPVGVTASGVRIRIPMTGGLRRRLVSAGAHRDQRHEPRPIHRGHLPRRGSLRWHLQLRGDAAESLGSVIVDRRCFGRGGPGAAAGPDQPGGGAAGLRRARAPVATGGRPARRPRRPPDLPRRPARRTVLEHREHRSCSRTPGSTSPPRSASSATMS